MSQPATRLCVVVLYLAGCAGPASSTPAAGGGALPEGDQQFDLEPSEFIAEVDHPYWPMAVGTRWTYREVDEEGVQLEVTVTVSSETRQIANGIVAVVVRDSVRSNGELLEDTFDWYAQDADGNVWYLGEETAEFENGEVVSTAGSWEAGVDGALAGVMLPAQPTPGQRYRQEFYRGEAEDNGEVMRIGERAEAPFGAFDDVIVTRDTSTLAPDVVEYKFYASDVGPILTLGVSGGGGREELIAVEDVDAEAAAAAGTTPLGEPYP